MLPSMININHSQQILGRTAMRTRNSKVVHNRLDKPVFLGVPNPLLTEFCNHHKLKSCDIESGLCNPILFLKRLIVTKIAVNNLTKVRCKHTPFFFCWWKLWPCLVCAQCLWGRGWRPYRASGRGRGDPLVDHFDRTVPRGMRSQVPQPRHQGVEGGPPHRRQTLPTHGHRVGHARLHLGASQR